MLVSISSWSYRERFSEGTLDLLSFLDEVKRLGADGVEVFPRHLEQDDPGGHLKQVAAKASEMGLAIASVIVANNFARPLARERADQVERMKQWIAYAGDARVERMNTFTGYHTPGEDPFLEAFRVIDAFREVMAVAEEHNVILCIENHSTVCTDADSLLHIVQSVGSDRLRLNPDFTNFVPDFHRRGDRAREAIYTETAKVAPLSANAHLKIREFTEEGDHAHLDVPRLLEIMASAGYDGHVVLEYYGRGDAAEACARGVALLRKLL
jgi:L-ribulose-5-phosphate 3-epimerase